MTKQRDGDRDFLCCWVIGCLLIAVPVLSVLYAAHGGDIKRCRAENVSLSNQVDILNDALTLEQASKRACAKEVEMWRSYFEKSGRK
jgi:hypothetical protein